jgi:hypothetical protein
MKLKGGGRKKKLESTELTRQTRGLDHGFEITS